MERKEEERFDTPQDEIKYLKAKIHHLEAAVHTTNLLNDIHSIHKCPTF
jgi:hypothetical protein